MIGLFGLYRTSPDTPADLAPLAATVPTRYAVECRNGTGAALGRTAHHHGTGGFAESANGRILAVSVGEIFNTSELVSGNAQGSPAHLALTLVEDGHLDALARANGLFALAIYDRDLHRLTLVTDHHASFPLHIWRREREAVFAGQIFTLLGDRRIPRKADLDAIAQLFTMQRTVGRTTSVAGVSALPAGCICEIDSGGIRERNYASLAWRKRDFTLDEGARLLADALRRACVRQAAGPRTGLLLSGGLDSRLVLAASPRGVLSCWTTASYEENPELAVARETAALFGAEHHALIVRPPDTLPILEDTVVESNGLYPASTAMAAFLPKVACHTILTGHGLDFTLRGYYLPARFAEIAGSRTRLPTLRPIPMRPTGADVLRSLRQGPPLATVARIAARAWRTRWWRNQEESMDAVLRPWLESAEPYDAWDAFILHALSKHYAFTGMMATRAVADLRMPAFDREVFDIYLRMPPAWRCNGRMVKLAIRHLSSEASRMLYANTGFRTDLDPWLEVGALMGRAALRRIGLVKRPALAESTHSPGSWHDGPALYRDDPGHRARFTEIRGRLDALCLGMLDADSLAICIDEHLDGRAEHTKLLRQLLTHDAWVRRYGIEGAA